MPTVSLTLDEIDSTIINPIVIEVIKDVANELHLPKDSLNILFKDFNITRTDNSITTTINEVDNLPTTVSKNRLIVRMEENYNEEDVNTFIITKKDAFPIFSDLDINVFIYPIYIKSDFNLEFRFISNSKSYIKRIRDDIRFKLAQMRNILHHIVDLYILIPESVEEFIADIHELKSRFFDMPLDQYAQLHFRRPMTLLTDLVGKNKQLAVKERQNRIVGEFDFTAMPDQIEVEQDTGNYILTFNYRFSMNLPRGLVLRYPVMICNRLIPTKYLPINEKDANKREVNRDMGYSSLGISHLSFFEAHRQLEYRKNDQLPIIVPFFDEIDRYKNHTGYGVVASFLLEVDETDKKTLMSLDDLGDYHIHPRILKFIKDIERQYITKPYMSFIYLGLWQDNRFFDANILEVNENLVVRSVKELELINATRVTISFITDLSMLHESVWSRILEYDPSLLLFFIEEYLRMLRDFMGEISKDYFYHFIKHLIKSMCSLYQMGHIDIIKDMFNIIKKNKVVADTFITTLYRMQQQGSDLIKYEKCYGLFDLLVSLGLIDINKVNNKLYINFVDNETGVMKTHMTFYIIANRVEN